jgi:hypothetical protein
MAKIILDLCGGSGAWSRPYAEAGYDVRLVTLPAQDVRSYQPPEHVYGILAAPPCTMFASSGARWKRTEEEIHQALEVVNACLSIISLCEPRFWALENPIGTLRRFIGPPAMYFQPCDYGDPYTKRTCLWGRFRPPFKYILREPVLGSKMWRMGESKQRLALRSMTPPGFARAFFLVNQ